MMHKQGVYSATIDKIVREKNIPKGFNSKKELIRVINA